MLEVRNLARSFGQGIKKVEVLKGVNFSLQPGGTAAILGRSGSGKSTLLSLLAGLDRPDSGEVIVSGERFSGLTESQLARFRARQIGIIFQQFHLLPHLTAHENVSLAFEISHQDRSKMTSGSIREKSAEALEAVGLRDRLSHLPSMLSGGEQQRVALARALIIEPQILLADEPSGSLDQETGHEITELLFNLVSSRKTTFILVTHDYTLASRCDESFELVAGTLSPHGAKKTDDLATSQ